MPLIRDAVKVIIARVPGGHDLELFDGKQSQTEYRHDSNCPKERQIYHFFLTSRNSTVANCAGVLANKVHDGNIATKAI